MCNAAPCPPSTCRCREPLVDKARPRTCYECGLPVAATVRCPDCGGTGKDAPWTGRWCDRCAGTGRVPARKEESRE